MTTENTSEDVSGNGQDGNESTSENETVTTTPENNEGEGQEKVGQEEEAPKVPEKYEDFTLPEGVELDAPLIESFKPLAKELGLTQENAQKLVDLQAKYVAEFNKQEQEAAEKEYNETVEQWKTAAKNDSEIGGEKLNEARSNAKKALDKLGSDGLNEVLEWSGLGNHPDVIRFLNKVTVELLAEDNVHTQTGGNSGNEEKSRAQRMFPSMN